MGDASTVRDAPFLKGLFRGEALARCLRLSLWDYMDVELLKRAGLAFTAFCIYILILIFGTYFCWFLWDLDNDICSSNKWFKYSCRFRQMNWKKVLFLNFKFLTWSNNAMYVCMYFYIPRKTYVFIDKRPCTYNYTHKYY